MRTVKNKYWGIWVIGFLLWSSCTAPYLKETFNTLMIQEQIVTSYISGYKLGQFDLEAEKTISDKFSFLVNSECGIKRNIFQCSNMKLLQTDFSEAVKQFEEGGRKAWSVDFTDLVLEMFHKHFTLAKETETSKRGAQ